MSSTIEDEPLWDVVEEHLDEAEFLWGAWEHALVAPNYTLAEVAEGPEERLLAHVDGLVVGGPPVTRRLLVPALEDDEPPRVAAAAAALLAGPGEAGVLAVFEALRELPEQRPALVRALACADRPDLLPRVRGLLADLDAELVAAAAEVLLFHHQPPGEALPVLLTSDDPAARALGLRALAGEQGAAAHVRAVQAGLADADEAIVDAAIDAGVRLGLGPAWARARARAQEPGGASATLLLALGGDAGDHALLLRALADAARRPAALFALGFLGTPEAVDASLEWLDDKAVGPLAGEVFTAVTGVDLDDANMSLGADEDEEALDHTPEDDLPRPDPMPVLQWWMKQRGRFAAGRRYVAGEPRTLATIVQALTEGPMRRRPALLLDLQLRAPAPLRLRLQPRAPTARQRSELAALQAALRGASLDVLSPRAK